MRWWVPGAILVLALGSSIYLKVTEVPFIEPILIGIGLLSVLLLLLWYIFLTGLRWKKRLILLSAVVVFLAGLIFGVQKFTRVEGSIGGSGIPKLVWKWTPRENGPGQPLIIAGSAASHPGAEVSETNNISFSQFLGPDRSGILTNANLSRDWNASAPKEVWRIPIGLGWSAFAVSGSHAITQEQRVDYELIVCYELSSGRALWAHTNRTRFSEALGGDGPRATPTLVDAKVYAMGASGILDCLDEPSGNVVWSRDVLRENQLSNITWGKSCSPLVTRGMVIVTGGEQREKTLLAYDARSGAPLWQSGRDRASYCSPMLVTLCGQEQILVVNGHSVTGHDVHNGAILWEYPWPDEYAKVTQPLVIDTDRVFIAAGYGVGCVMLSVEHPGTGGWVVKQLWKNRNLKPKFTNLVRRGNHVYGLDEGVLTCLNLDTGGREWKETRYGHGQILMVGDLLLVQAEAGDVALVEVSPTAARELGRIPALKSKTWNNPVLAGDLLLVRNDREAICFRLPMAPPSP